VHVPPGYFVVAILGWKGHAVHAPPSYFVVVIFGVEGACCACTTKDFVSV
jgi:hypothetical protein